MAQILNNPEEFEQVCRRLKELENEKKHDGENQDLHVDTRQSSPLTDLGNESEEERRRAEELEGELDPEADKDDGDDAEEDAEHGA